MYQFNLNYSNMSISNIEEAEEKWHRVLDEKLRNMKIDDELEMVYKELESISEEKQRREQENV